MRWRQVDFRPEFLRRGLRDYTVVRRVKIRWIERNSVEASDGFFILLL